jgi:hypothetical protein
MKGHVQSGFQENEREGKDAEKSLNLYGKYSILSAALRNMNG